MEIRKDQNVKRAFRLLSLFLGMGSGVLVGTSLKYFISNNFGGAVYLVLLASISAKFAEWFSFNGLGG